MSIDVLLGNVIVSVDSRSKIQVILYNLAEIENNIHKVTWLTNIHIWDTTKYHGTYYIHGKNQHLSHIGGLLDAKDQDGSKPDDKVKIKDLIKQYFHIFSKPNTVVGHCKKVKREIFTKDTRHIFCQIESLCG